MKFRLNLDQINLLDRLSAEKSVLTIQSAGAGKSLEKRGLVKADWGAGKDADRLVWKLTEAGRAALADH